jgi:hypothetical protein
MYPRRMDNDEERSADAPIREGLTEIGRSIASKVPDAFATVAAAATVAVVAPGHGAGAVVVSATVAMVLKGLAAAPRSDAALQRAQDARIDELDGRVATLLEILGKLAERARAERLVPLVDEVVRLVRAGAIDCDAAAHEEHLERALSEAYRRAADSIDPKVAPALGRLVQLYATRALDRPGRAYGELLMNLEPGEWDSLRLVAAALAEAAPLAREYGSGEAAPIRLWCRRVDGGGAIADMSIKGMLGGPHPSTRSVDSGAATRLLPLFLRFRVGAPGDAAGETVRFSIAGATEIAWLVLGGDPPTA